MASANGDATQPISASAETARTIEFEAIERDGQPAGSLPGEPISRETWNDPATDHHHQHHDPGDGEPDAMLGISGPVEFKMECKVADKKARK